MTTVETAELQRSDADHGEPRLPSIIDGWVRDGLVSAHSAMRVFNPTVGRSDTRGTPHPVPSVEPMEIMGYIGAGIVALGGLAMMLDSSVGLSARLLVGVLIMIAMRHVIRPLPASRSVGLTAPTPRHRNDRRIMRRDRS